MKKSTIAGFVVLLVIFYIFGIVTAAEPCDITISLINQDPYPAIPGDYVKVVFQIDGIQNSACKVVTFGVKEDYPIHLDPNVQNPITINSGIYEKNYGSFYLAPYKLRLDENALDGDNPIEVYYSNSGASNVIKEFDITVEDIRADFEIHVKNYDYTTRELTFEILNIAEADVQALTLEIPKQEGIEIKGANRIVVGDLDSNEYTTADFEAILPEGQTNINLNVIYTDSINTRRELQKVVDFDSSYFIDRTKDQKKQPYWLYILIVAVIAFFVWRRISKKKREKERMKKRGMM
ncbi:MAG: hypothetical protein NTZ83_05385 [Candidatus Pacearchaeota archaeon]|nr:hypothetical protein [Candidatus Pacearchaeota archaeon]